MGMKRFIHETRSYLYLLVLFGLSLVLAGCGPDSRQASFLVSWAPDGCRVALVPNFMDDTLEASGVWIYSSNTGRKVQVAAVRKDVICAHPRWSPSGDELLFAAVDKRQSESPEVEGSIPFSVWAVGSEGQAPRQLAESESTDGDAFLIPNAVMWGPTAGTILFQKAVGDKVMVLELNLKTEALSQYLPDVSDQYRLEPSPDRSRVAAILFDKESESARVYLADFARGDWRLIDNLEFDRDQIGISPVIYWAPDSSQFVVPEKPKGAAAAGREQGSLRLFDARSGASCRIFSANPASAIFWNRQSSVFVFSEQKGLNEIIRRVDLRSGTVNTIVPDGRHQLLGWNHEDGRIYFFRAEAEENSKAMEDQGELLRLFSCTATGTDARSLGLLSANGKPSWSLSPGCNQMMIFDAPDAPAHLNFSSALWDQIQLLRK